MAGRVRGAPPLVVLEHVTKRFPGVLANDDVDLDLRAGEVHALIGENGAGKSTLMRVLYGMYPADTGRIAVRGRRGEDRVASGRDRARDRDGPSALRPGRPVHRDRERHPRRRGRRGARRDDAERRVGELAQSYGFQVDPSATVEELSVGEEQRVEILKALYRGVEILILDEPTAVLTPTETKDLFGNLRKLREAGKTIVFISHKLDEVLEIADRITVLRRGKVVGETTAGRDSKAKLAEMMVGRPVLFRLEKPRSEIGEPVLRVEELRGSGQAGRGRASTCGPARSWASPAWRATGSGSWPRRSWACGRRSAGAMTVDGAEITGALGAARSATPASGYIPEDRHEQGLVLDMALWENAVLGRQDDAAVRRAGGRALDQDDQGAGRARW